MHDILHCAQAPGWTALLRYVADKDGHSPEAMSESLADDPPQNSLFPSHSVVAVSHRFNHLKNNPWLRFLPVC
ncbi:MAG: hypothetical protein OEY05_02190 [Paracoccaceae bacterium]|nr:hypothetical protein [Paracoccaceae bacterium]